MDRWRLTGGANWCELSGHAGFEPSSRPWTATAAQSETGMEQVIQGCGWKPSPELDIWDEGLWEKATGPECHHYIDREHESNCGIRKGHHASFSSESIIAIRILLDPYQHQAWDTEETQSGDSLSVSEQQSAFYSSFSFSILASFLQCGLTS